jgi:hypothetical protein
MFPLSRIPCLTLAAVGSLVLCDVQTFALAGDQIEALGPVGPHEPILTKFDGKHLIAFYTPSNNNCDLQAVVWGDDNSNDTSAARVLVSLTPGQVVHIDTPDHRSINLQCGDRAKTLALINPVAGH